MKRDEAIVSYTMSRIKGKDTSIELKLRKELYHKGYRYRANSKYIYGHPDISFKGYKVAIFCDSEFWHGYDFETNKAKLKTHLDYWIPKIERNIRRDKEVNDVLASQGYEVLRFWGFEINNDIDGVVARIERALEKKGYKKPILKR